MVPVDNVNSMGKITFWFLRKKMIPIKNALRPPKEEGGRRHLARTDGAFFKENYCRGIILLFDVENPFY